MVAVAVVAVLGPVGVGVEVGVVVMAAPSVPGFGRVVGGHHHPRRCGASIGLGVTVAVNGRVVGSSVVGRVARVAVSAVSQPWRWQ